MRNLENNDGGKMGINWNKLIKITIIAITVIFLVFAMANCSVKISEEETKKDALETPLEKCIKACPSISKIIKANCLDGCFGVYESQG